MRKWFVGCALVALACGDTTTPPVDPVATSILLSEPSIELVKGDELRVSATVLDQGGDDIDDAPVLWQSDDTLVATVSTSGLIRGIGAGSTEVRAQSGQVWATVSVVVSDPAEQPQPPQPPPPPPPPPANGPECDDPAQAWIWCDDFEQNRLSSYFEYNAGGGAFSRVDGVGLSGSTGMRMRWTAGLVTGGWLWLGIGRTPDSYRRSVGPAGEDQREVHWRFWVRAQPGWTGGGGHKISRATVFHSPSHWGQAMAAHVWAGGNTVTIDPASGTDVSGTPQTTGYNDFPNFRWLGYRTSNTPIFDAAHVGEWYCIEVQVRLNSTGSSNGIFRLWIDDQLEAERTDLNWVGNYDDYGINAIALDNYWNDGAPRTQDRFLDNFVVSRERIGCG